MSSFVDAVDAHAASGGDRRFEERDHDLLSALVAIEGGLRVLQARTVDDVDGDLIDALVREVALARGLLAPTTLVRAETATDVGPLLSALAVGERARGARIDVRADDHLRAAIPEADLHQVLRNLLDNARRHAPGAPVHLGAHRLDGATVVVEVRDQGPGIPTELLPSVTGRGVRAGTAEGSGLGLHVTATLVARAGGALSIGSGADGTTVSVSLPAARTEPPLELVRVAARGGSVR